MWFIRQRNPLKVKKGLTVNYPKYRDSVNFKGYLHQFSICSNQSLERLQISFVTVFIEIDVYNSYNSITMAPTLQTTY